MYGDTHKFTYGNGKHVPEQATSPQWIFDCGKTHSELKTGHLMLAFGIMHRSDVTLVCWPKQVSLAEEVKMGRSTVNRLIRELEEKKLFLRLWLYRGNECSGCVYVANIHGWLDDIVDDRSAILERVLEARANATKAHLPVMNFPPGTQISAKPKTKGKG